MPKYVIEKKDRCPICQNPKTITARYPEEKVKTGKGKIEKYETGRTVIEWKCRKCGNSGFEYE